MNKRELLAYETDASRLIGKAEKVVFPESIEEVMNTIKKTNIDIIPRGAGTGLVGGCVPNNTLIIDINKMNKLLRLDKIKRNVK